MEDLVHAAFPICKVNQQEDSEFMAPFIEMHRMWKMENMYTPGAGLILTLRGRWLDRGRRCWTWRRRWRTCQEAKGWKKFKFYVGYSTTCARLTDGFDHTL
eukprot:TRINITY_DN36151_c0_g1_i1.p1 TRINITY_DN36151_c0_g1~~TRINITY_DN36151_c0_g1_i1.p1  ORF type:complete len:101 (-),score=18.87 TRINITY_DN36151_c0_g1_i1:19-321(-)